MASTIVDLLASLPAPELRTLVETTLRRRGELKSTREHLERALDATIVIDGFRKSHAAPIAKLASMAVAAFVERHGLALAVAIARAWGELHADDTDDAIHLVQAAGLESTSPSTLGKPFGTWQPGQLEQLVADLLDRRPGLTARLAALLACACAGRYADLGAITSPSLAPSPASPTGPAPADPLAPLWRRTLDTAKELPPDAAEWSSIEPFAASLRELRAIKAREAQDAAGAAELAEALTLLQRVPEAVVSFFDLTGPVAEWLVAGSRWRSKSEAAERIRRIAGILVEAEPLTRPAATLSERRRQAEPLEAAARALREATEAIAATKEPAPEAPAPTAPSAHDDVPAPAPAAAAPPSADSTLRQASPTISFPSPANEADSAPLTAQPIPIRTDEETAKAVEREVTPSDRPVPAPDEGPRVEEPVEAPRAEAPTHRADNAPEAPPIAAEPSAPPPGPAAPALPRHLRSYGEFSSTNWISPSGTCEEVPWKAASFTAKLDGAAREAMAAKQFVELWLVTRALGELGAAPANAAAAVRALAEILAAPTSATSGSYPDRSASLREAELVGGPWPGSSCSSRPSGPRERPRSAPSARGTWWMLPGSRTLSCGTSSWRC